MTARFRGQRSMVLIYIIKISLNRSLSEGVIAKLIVSRQYLIWFF